MLCKGLCAIALSAAMLLPQLGAWAGDRPDNEFFIYWSSGPLEHLPGGRVRLALTLTPSRAGVELPRPENYCRLLKLQDYYRGIGAGPPRLVAREWTRTDNGLWQLVLYASENVRADVFARVEQEGRTYYAQSSFTLFGRAGREEALTAPLENEPAWPEFEAGPAPELFWPQTGREITLRPLGFKQRPAVMRVWDRGELRAALQAEKDGFRYTPKRDPLLDQAGATAVKALVFATGGAADERASFTLFIHRSRTDGADLPSGLLLFASSILVTGSGVYLAGKRAPC